LEIVWEAAAIAEKANKEGKIAEAAKLQEEIRARKEEMRRDGQKPVPGGSL
jgi:hypothetical protein